MEHKDQELVDLIARCALKDQMALKALYERLSGYLNAVAFRILKSDDLANEALQEAFIQIWENASSYRPHKAKALTWITSILRYRALDRLDKEKRYMYKFQAPGEEEDPISTIAADDSMTPESTTMQTQTEGQIVQCLETLADRARQSIKLAYLEGYSREEIAEKLETNTNTVKSWLRRGSERLKRCLEQKIEATN